MPMKVELRPDAVTAKDGTKIPGYLACLPGGKEYGLQRISTALHAMAKPNLDEWKKNQVLRYIRGTDESLHQDWQELADAADGFIQEAIDETQERAEKIKDHVFSMLEGNEAGRHEWSPVVEKFWGVLPAHPDRWEAEIEVPVGHLKKGESFGGTADLILPTERTLYQLSYNSPFSGRDLFTVLPHEHLMVAALSVAAEHTLDCKIDKGYLIRFDEDKLHSKVIFSSSAEREPLFNVFLGVLDMSAWVRQMSK